MAGNRAETFAAAVARARDLALTAIDVVPGAKRLVLELKRVEIIDRSMIIAAQALFSVTPLLVVLAAFMPETFASTLVERVSHVMGMDANDAAVDSAALTENVRRETGVLGIALVLVSALSFARAFQRTYERIWEKPHQGGVIGIKRCMFWLISWVMYLQLAAWFLALMTRDGLGLLAFALGVLVNWALWWWTSHTLLLGRIPYRGLWLGALITAVALGVMSRASSLVMPRYVEATTEQFGGIGLMLAASTWLLVFGGVIVIAGIVGRVVVEDRRIPLPEAWRPPPHDDSEASPDPAIADTGQWA